MLRNKKGVTLIEIVIVLALVAIIGVMVASFTVLTSGWVGIGTLRDYFLEDKSTADEFIKDFVNYFDTEDYKFVATVDGIKAVNKNKSGEEYKLSFSICKEEDEDSEDGKYRSRIRAQYPSSERPVKTDPETGDPVSEEADKPYEKQLNFKTIENSIFNVETNDIGKQLVVCRMFYYLGNASKDENKAAQSFVVSYATRIAGLKIETTINAESNQP